jgi:exopolysaccharide biosynthesis polyprenyl glycosylphosphotransferase
MVSLWLVAAWWLKLYSSRGRLSGRRLLLRAAEASVLVVGLTIITTFFSRGFGIGTSRSFVLLFGPVSLTTLILARALSPVAAVSASRRWALRTSVAVLGSAHQATRLANRLLEHSFAPEIKGVILPEAEAPSQVSAMGMRVLGTTGQLAEVINRERLDRLIVLTGSLPEREVETCSVISRRMGIAVSCSLAMETSGDNLNLSLDYGVPLVDVNPIAFTRTQEVVKRICDLIGASVSIVLLSPLMLLIATLIKLTSKGPVFYTAPRVGRGGRHFMFFKFRSMTVSADKERAKLRNEKDGHIFKVKNDHRVTPLGRFLRRYSLDELAQLINVIRGEMSLVGPRPLPAEDLDPDGMSRQFATWSEQRARVRPGITGLWQVKGRSQLPFADMIRYDTEYIRDWSLLLDLKILLVTPTFVLSGRGAC